MSNFTVHLKRAVFVLSFGLLWSVVQAAAAVTLDARAGSGAADNLGLSSLAWSHTVGGGAARALVVGVSTATTTLPASLPANRVQTVTYGGAALTRVGTVAAPNTLNASEIFVLVNPPVGAANVVVTFGTTVGAVPIAFVNQAAGNSVSFFGVSPTQPTGAFASASGTGAAPSVSVAGSAAGDFVFDNLAVSPTAGFVNPPIGANQTVCADETIETTCTRGRRFFGFAYDIGAVSTEAGAAGAVLMNWQTTNADSFALGAVAVRQSVPTAGTVSVGGRVTDQNGRAAARARVTIAGADGAVRAATTNPFGYYRFAEVNAGETYILNVYSKRHSFAPRVLAINEDTAELNFAAEP